MFKVEVTGFQTKEQAEAFINWYDGQGEQDASIWFKCRKEEGEIDISRMNTDCRKTFPIKWNGDTAKLVLEIGGKEG